MPILEVTPEKRPLLIESVDLVVTALGAGAAAGLTNTATTAVKDAYEGLKSLTRKALTRADVDAVAVLEDPEAHGEELRAALADAGPDPELVAAARALLELIDPKGTKYQIDVHDNQGVQIGDGNSMTLNLGPTK